MRIYSPPKPADAIPIIDLKAGLPQDGAGRRAVAWDIHKACRETGFFYISNHGVPSALVQGQFDAARRLFDLPLADKLLLHMKNSSSRAGYEPIGGQTLDSQAVDAEQGPPDLKESFYIGAEMPGSQNQWPASLFGFREQTLAYQARLRGLADDVLALIAVSLDLPEGHFAPFFDQPSQTVRLIKYPPQPPDSRFNQLGAGAHTDWGGITILAQDDIGGLEVENVAGEWIEAPPVAGTFVVNLGDLMARWTNDLYRSNFHRVRNNDRQNRARYSVPFFYNPRKDALIECLPTCLDGGASAHYPTVTAGRHIDEMFRRSYGYS